MAAQEKVDLAQVVLDLCVDPALKEVLGGHATHLQSPNAAKYVPARLAFHHEAETENVLRTGSRRVPANPYPEKEAKEKGHVYGPYFLPSENSVYVGHLSGDKRSGRGLLVSLAQGKLKYVYEGLFENDQPAKSGRYLLTNGDAYQGEVSGGSLTGHGTLFSAQHGTRYTGDFTGDLPNGQGTEEWPDGSVYVGSFVSGKKQGRGTLNSNGHVMEGEFKDGALSGQGSYKLPDRTLLTGQWVKSVLISPATIIYPDGRRYFGDVSEKLVPEGKGTLESNYRKVEGTFKQGHLDGEARVTLYSTGEEKIGIFKMGQLVEYRGIKDEHLSPVFKTGDVKAVLSDTKNENEPLIVPLPQKISAPTEKPKSKKFPFCCSK